MTLHYDIQLQPKGRLVRIEWDQATGTLIEQQIPPDEFAFHLHDALCLSREVVFRDLVALLASNLELFSALTACDCLGEIVAEADKSGTEGLAVLELAWSVQIVPESSALVLDSVAEFHGLGADGAQIGLEFATAGSLAEIPFLLNETFNVQNGPAGEVLSATRRFTLLDVVTSVVDELTFLGSPEERDEAMQDLHRRLQSVEGGEFYTVEEVKTKWEQLAEKERGKFPCRVCGEDSRCACFGKPADLCHRCFCTTREN